MTDTDFDDAFNPLPSPKHEEVVEDHVHEPEVHEQETTEEVQDPQDLENTTEEHEEEVEEKVHKAVPLHTFLDMRDKMKQERDEAERIRQEYEAFKRQHTAKEEVEIIDPLVNPKEYAKQLTDQVEQAVLNERINFSKIAAIRAHGKDATQTAIDWAYDRANKDRTFNESIKNQADPIDWVIQQHKADADAQLRDSDPVAWAQNLLESKGLLNRAAEAKAEVAQETPAKKVTRSLTGATGAGNAQLQSSAPRDPFEAAFNPRK